MTFLVAGLTGQTGAAAASTLLAAGRKVRGLVRSRSKAGAWESRGVDLVEGDIADPAALARALDGVEGAYLLAPPNLASPDPVADYAAVAQSVREAAGRSGLRRLVFLSSEAAHLPAGTGPIRGLHRAEEILAGAVPHLTFLRASYFQENWLSVFGLAAQQGILPSLLLDPAKRRPMVATADIGRVAAELLLDAAPPAIVELEGPEPASAADVAAAMSAVLGRPVAPVVVPPEQWVPTLTGAGVGPAYAALIAEMYAGIESGHVTFSGTVPRRRGTQTVRDTVAAWPVAKAA